MEWLLNVVIAAIISSVVSIGLISLLIARLQLSLDLKSSGVKRIHKRGNKVKAMENALQNAKEIKQIAVNSHGFITCYKTLLEKKANEGCSIKFLLGKPYSTVLKETSSMVLGHEDDFSRKVELSINLLKSIKSKTSSNKMEVRHYNTEMSNPVTLIIDNDDNIRAFLTVFTPPKASADSLMLEFEDKDACDCRWLFCYVAMEKSP